jgi:dolichol-phosphate mannosyltransferase
MANEEADFDPFVALIKATLDKSEDGNRLFYCRQGVKRQDAGIMRILIRRAINRFKTIWAPENKNVVDAYIRGYREALKNTTTRSSSRWMPASHTIHARYRCSLRVLE